MYVVPSQYYTTTVCLVQRDFLMTRCKEYILYNADSLSTRQPTARTQAEPSHTMKLQGCQCHASNSYFEDHTFYQLRNADLEIGLVSRCLPVSRAPQSMKCRMIVHKTS